MSGIAEVLAAHYEYNWEPDAESWECQCGHLLGEDVFRRDADPNHRAHQAAMLTAAGFGPVKEAAEQAWDEAYQTGVDDERISQSNAGIAGCFCHSFPCQCFIAPARANPYRAAAVRGEL